jgi:hypothetical protein
MANMCPKCNRCTVEFDKRQETWKCFAIDCSWISKDVNESIKVEYKDNAADKMLYILTNGSRPSPSL